MSANFDLVSWPKREDVDHVTALAFSFGGHVRQATHTVAIITWSEHAHSNLQALGNILRAQNRALPRRALRARIELAEHTLLRLDQELGMGRLRTIAWCQQSPVELINTLSDAVMGWLVEDLAPLFAEEALVIVAQLKEAARNRTIISIAERTTNPYEWGTTQSKTAKATTPSGYVDLADFVARHLEGIAVFPELPPLRRVAGGELTSGYAELMTEAIAVGRGSRFSLVVRLQIMTFPGRATPIVTVGFSRRIWISGLKDRASADRITAYAFPPGATRAFPFTLELDSKKLRGAEGVERYMFGPEFAPIARRYLPGRKITVEEVVRRGHLISECPLFVGLRYGSGERSEVKQGVPDLDKIEGFDGMTAIVRDIGLVPWQGLEVLDKGRSVEDTDQHWAHRESIDMEKREDYAAWRAEAQASIRSCYDREHHLVIGVQQDGSIEGDANTAATLLQEILGEGVVTTRIPIPPDVHGPREILPLAHAKNPERAQARMEAWQPFIDSVQRLEQIRPVDGILIIARRWYEAENVRPDDPINKRSARIALAKALGKPVQYLLPRKDMEASNARRKRPSAEDITRDFEQRLMMAWRDLAYKSLGRVRQGKLLEKAESIYQGEQLSFLNTYPDRIIALGVIRRNRTRYLWNERSFLPYVIELNVETGLCQACFAYEDAGSKQLTWSTMLPLPQALVALARLGPVQLVGDRDRTMLQTKLSDRTQAFFKVVLSERCRDSLNPLIIVDADSCRSVWPWLKDELIDPSNVQLGGGYNEQVAWPHARMVRVRTNNAPKVLRDGRHVAVKLATNEPISRRAPVWMEAALLRLTDTRQSNVYFSFGSDVRKRIRGRSCYRSISAFEQKKIDDKRSYVASLTPPLTDAWMTPSGLEIVVVRTGKDTPEQTARLVAWLRQCYEHFGAWTLKPAPLFFEGVLKEYLADFEIEDEDIATGSQEYDE